MKKIATDLVTPVYLKTGVERELPADPAAYVLSSSGLYFCRNHRFFQSCVPAPRWPRELDPHSASLKLHYPKIAREPFEQVVGFFAQVARRHAAEAIVLLLFDHQAGEIRFHVPRQKATVGQSFTGKQYPVDLKYDPPGDLDPNVSLIGDIHSHADEAAYASYKDKLDEVHQAGVHIVVGRVHDEPPDLHCEFVVDGYRFLVSHRTILQGYHKRNMDVPQEWLDQVTVSAHTYQVMSKGKPSTGSSTGLEQGSDYYYPDPGPDPGDDWRGGSLQ